VDQQFSVKIQNFQKNINAPKNTQVQAENSKLQPKLLSTFVSGL